jgi:hypothetical protein
MSGRLLSACCDGLALDFRSGGNAREFLGDGWSFAESIGTWAVGDRSEVRLPPTAHSGLYGLRISVVPMLWPPAVTSQHISLRMNGRALLQGQARKNEVCTFSCEVPAGVMAFDRTNLLEILHEDGAAPASIGDSADRRVLSLRFVSLSIESRDPLELERTLSKSRPLFLITGLALPGQRPMLELPRFLACDECEMLLWIDFKDPSDFGSWKSAVQQELPSAHVELAPRAVWGGPSTVQSILGGIGFAIDRIPNWTRLVVCSDRDAPLVGRDEMLERISSLKAYDFVGSRWNRSTNDIIPKLATIPIVDSVLDHRSFRCYRVRQEMVFKVEEPLTQLYPEDAIRSLTIARTMPNRYRAAISEGSQKDALILSRLTRTRAAEREKFWRSVGLIAGRLWIMVSRKLAEMLVSDQANDIFSEGFRDVLNTDECFFQSIASFYQSRGEVEPLWSGFYFDDARVFRIDRTAYSDMLRRKVGTHLFARKAVEHFRYDQIVG